MSTRKAPVSKRSIPLGKRSVLLSAAHYLRMSFNVTLSRAFLAATVSAILALGLHLLIGLPTLAEAFGEGTTRILPLPLFSALLSIFGHSAKTVLVFTIIVLGTVLMAGVGMLVWGFISWIQVEEIPQLTRLYRRYVGTNPAYMSTAVITLIVLLLWIIEAGFIAPILGGGFLGSALPDGVFGTFVAQLFPSCLFAFMFQQLMERMSETVTVRTERVKRVSLSRRQLLQRGTIALVAAATGWFVLNGVLTRISTLFAGGERPPLALGNVPKRLVPPPVPTYTEWPLVQGQTAEITATKDFYYVSKNLIKDPAVDISSWQLQITGLVQQPYALTFDQLRALPAVERYHTLECISNDVGGTYISTALFHGVRLADVLNVAGIQSDAQEVIFHAADGYSDALHLSQALDPRALLIYHINGENLPTPHGFPVRLLVPGVYGMKNGKWLTGLELGSGGYMGYWEQRGWTQEARVKIMSRIDTPTYGDLLPATPTAITGIAYASDQGIAQVQVSVDGGITWQPALLRRPLDPLTWTLWKFPWSPTKGQYTIAVRAITLDGTIQQPDEAPPLPDGSSGYHAIRVTIA